MGLGIRENARRRLLDCLFVKCVPPISVKNAPALCASVSKMFLATDDDDDASSRQREAMRRHAYLAELDAQVAMKRERERREAAAYLNAKMDDDDFFAFEFDDKHAHRSHAHQYARAVSAFGNSVGVLTPPGCVRAGRDDEEDDDDSASVEVEVAEERRRVARRKAELRMDLERQIEAKRAAREAEREEMMRLEVEEERRIRMEREEMMRRMRPAGRRAAAADDDGDFMAMEEGDIFVEESTFVAIPEDETTSIINVRVERESVAHKAPSPSPKPSPRSIEKELGFVTPVATEKPPSHDDSPPLQRQESTVKKLAAMFERAHAQD